MKCKKAKCWSEEALIIAEKKRKVKGKGEKERYIHLNAKFQRIAQRDKKAFFSEMQRNRGKEQNGKDQGKFLKNFSSRKLEISRDHFMQRWEQ